MLSQKARYALRALLDVAAHGGDGSVQLGAIAARQALPRKFLEAIMVDLKRAGLVESRRGPGGGYRLARPAAEISFADVMRATDGPIAIVPCASENFYARCADCYEEATCVIRKVMIEMRERAVEVLAGMSLADAARDEPSPAPYAKAG